MWIVNTVPEAVVAMLNVEAGCRRYGLEGGEVVELPGPWEAFRVKYRAPGGPTVEFALRPTLGSLVVLDDSRDTVDDLRVGPALWPYLDQLNQRIRPHTKHLQATTASCSAYSTVYQENKNVMPYQITQMVATRPHGLHVKPYTGVTCGRILYCPDLGNPYVSEHLEEAHALFTWYLPALEIAARLLIPPDKRVDPRSPDDTTVCRSYATVVLDPHGWVSPAARRVPPLEAIPRGIISLEYPEVIKKPVTCYVAASFNCGTYFCGEAQDTTSVQGCFSQHCPPYNRAQRVSIGRLREVNCVGCGRKSLLIHVLYDNCPLCLNCHLEVGTRSYDKYYRGMVCVAPQVNGARRARLRSSSSGKWAVLELDECVYVTNEGWESSKKNLRLRLRLAARPVPVYKIHAIIACEI